MYATQLMELIEKFKDYLKENNKSENTINGYILDLKGYFTWFKTSFGYYPKKLFRDNVLDYKTYLLNNKHLSAPATNRILRAISSYNNSLLEAGTQEEVAIRKKDFVKYQAEYISPTKINKQEVNQFMQSILETGNKRNYAIIGLLRYTGMRISECLNLKFRDIDLNTRECFIRKGKGNKDRKVFLSTRAVNIIKSYVDTLGGGFQDDDLLFKGKEGQLDRTVINKLFKKYSNKITPHQLRHFFCTELANSGTGIQEIAYMAGHTNTATTMRYTHPDEGKMRERLEML